MDRLRTFLKHDVVPGLLLVSAAALALVLDNTPLAWLYDGLLSTPVVVQVGELEIAKPLLLWINDGLMAVFFFLIGLEIKREILEGELSSRDKVMLPAIAAVGGMAVPALIYYFVNSDSPETISGWAIPAATDIAFALGVLALLGRRVPVALKVFLLAIAVIDDLGAIVIIGLFYTADTSVLSLALGAGGLVVLVAMNRFGVTKIAPYILVGIAIWVCVLKSGVHATLAGVLIAFTIPLRVRNEAGERPASKLEHALHPWVAFGILPIFAFANAGVSLQGFDLSTLLEPVPLGIALGLFVGKQIGVFGFTLLAVKAGIGRLPSGVTWLQVYGVSLLTGIGFTMSLFIGTLAFDAAEHATGVRLGVLGGSLLAGVGGYLVLRWSLSLARRRQEEVRPHLPAGAKAEAAE